MKHLIFLLLLTSCFKPTGIRSYLVPQSIVNINSDFIEVYYSLPQQILDYIDGSDESEDESLDTDPLMDLIDFSTSYYWDENPESIIWNISENILYIKAPLEIHQNLEHHFRIWSSLSRVNNNAGIQSYSAPQSKEDKEQNLVKVYYSIHQKILDRSFSSKIDNNVVIDGHALVELIYSITNYNWEEEDKSGIYSFRNDLLFIRAPIEVHEVIDNHLKILCKISKTKYLKK